MDGSRHFSPLGNRHGSKLRLSSVVAGCEDSLPGCFPCLLSGNHPALRISVQFLISTLILGLLLLAFTPPALAQNNDPEPRRVNIYFFWGEGCPHSMTKVFTVISFLGWIQVVVALVALTFALINIKDYFWYKESVSLSISDKHKPKIYRDIRSQAARGKSIWALIGATVAMALGISLVELPCAAGFPVLWTKIVAAQQPSTATFVMLLAVYMLIYLLDELIFFGAAVVTLRASKMEEKQGRILKLIGGTVMLTLAVVLLVDPTLMNDISSSMAIFGAAFGATLTVLIVHRKVLPRFGVKIGTEFATDKTQRRRKRARS